MLAAAGFCIALWSTGSWKRTSHAQRPVYMRRPASANMQSTTRLHIQKSGGRCDWHPTSYHARPGLLRRERTMHDEVPVEGTACARLGIYSGPRNLVMFLVARRTQHRTSSCHVAFNLMARRMASLLFLINPPPVASLSSLKRRQGLHWQFNICFHHRSSQFFLLPDRGARSRGQPPKRRWGEWSRNGRLGASAPLLTPLWTTPSLALFSHVSRSDPQERPALPHTTQIAPILVGNRSGDGLFAANRCNRHSATRRS